MSATVAAGGDTRNLTWRKGELCPLALCALAALTFLVPPGVAVVCLADTSTFAYRMMQKMGWSEGKGLGKNETGTASNIRMARRPEMLGSSLTHVAPTNASSAPVASHACVCRTGGTDR